jgi:hypothetical protein
VEPSEEPRPNLLDHWEGRCGEADLPDRGFLNWGELRALIDSGHVEIASHSLTHTWYPTSARIVDYHRPGAFHPWLAWNAHPDRKPFYQNENQEDMIPWGTPVYEHGRSLGVRRFLPDPGIGERTVEHVARHGGAAFFARDDWRRELDGVAAAGDTGRGRLETEAEQLERYRHEIIDCRRLLEERLQTKVPHFCFPGGAYNDLSWSVAEAAGHETIVVTRRDRKRWFSTDPRLVHRFSPHNRIAVGGRTYDTRNPAFLYDACEVRRGNRWRAWLLRARKLRLLLGHGIRPAGI